MYKKAHAESSNESSSLHNGRHTSFPVYPSGQQIMTLVVRQV